MQGYRRGLRKQCLLVEEGFNWLRGSRGLELVCNLWGGRNLGGLVTYTINIYAVYTAIEASFTSQLTINLQYLKMFTDSVLIGLYILRYTNKFWSTSIVAYKLFPLQVHILQI